MSDFRQRTSVPVLTDDEEGAKFVNEVGVVFHLSSKKEFTKNPLRRFVSTELEIAELGPEWQDHSPLRLAMKTLPINEIVEHWGAQLVADISLPYSGFEINTAPANGDRFIQQIEEILGTLAKFKASCTNTRDTEKRVQPCGMHVHIDARDMSYNDLRRFLLLYAFLEPTLFLMLPGYRRHSHYCVPCGDRYARMVLAGKPIKPKARKAYAKLHGTTPDKATLIDAVYQDRVPRRHDKRACPQATRYGALNLHQWFYRGTLEIRLMYGTVDPAEVIPWAMLMGGLVDWALKTPESHIYDLTRPTRSPAVLLREHIACTPEVGAFVERQLERFKNEPPSAESPMLRQAMNREQRRGQQRMEGRLQQQPTFQDPGTIEPPSQWSFAPPSTSASTFWSTVSPNSSSTVSIPTAGPALPVDQLSLAEQEAMMLRQMTEILDTEGEDDD